MTLIGRVRKEPEWKLPPVKRAKGRKQLASIASMTNGIGRASSAIVDCVLRHTGFLDKLGGGELGIAINVSAFLCGWETLLRHAIQNDLVSTTLLRHLARFACNPHRLCLKSNGLALTRCRCSKSNLTCPFRLPPQEVPGAFGFQGSVLPARCSVSDVDALTKPQLRLLVLKCGLKRFNRHVVGDPISIAERVIQIYVRRKEIVFAKNDKLKAARASLPPPSQWLGVRFQLKPNTAVETFATYVVLGTRLTAKGRVAAINCYDARDETSPFWIRIRANGNHWKVVFCYCDDPPLPMSSSRRRLYLWGCEFGVPAFDVPGLRFRLAWR